MVVSLLAVFLLCAFYSVFNIAIYIRTLLYSTLSHDYASQFYLYISMMFFLKSLV